VLVSRPTELVTLVPFIIHSTVCPVPALVHDMSDLPSPV
jgi:hypothetical protein